MRRQFQSLGRSKGLFLPVRRCVRLGFLFSFSLAGKKNSHLHRQRHSSTLNIVLWSISDPAGQKREGSSLDMMVLLASSTLKRRIPQAGEDAPLPARKSMRRRVNERLDSSL